MDKNLKKVEETIEGSIKRIGGYLHKVEPIVDEAGKVINYAVKPLMVEFSLKDVMQIIVGSLILAIPVGFTEEVWNLSETLPRNNVFILTGISLLFIAIFVYFNFYKKQIKGYVFEYIKRVAAIYLISLVIVALFLTIIDKCPWGIDNILAIKRIILVAFPASMSATISDTLK